MLNERANTDLEGHKSLSKYWPYITLPANIAIGPISALIILQILALNGNVLDASYAITLGTAITIPASYFWGKISDIYNSRRRQILVSYIGITICIASLFFSKSVLEIIIAYMALNFFSIANATPLNLLVMESTKKEHWPSTFSKLQTISSVGITLGFVVAVFATTSTSLSNLILLLVTASIISILMSNKLVWSPPIKATRLSIIKNSFAFISRMLMHPIISVQEPTSKFFERIFKLKRVSKRLEHTNYITLLYISGFIFFAGSAILYTIYPAGLSQHGLKESSVFFVLLFALILQTSTFFYSGRYVESHLTHRIIKRSLIFRTVCYLLLAISFIFLTGNSFFFANVIFYALASGVAYSFYYTASYSLVFKELKGIDKGSGLGLYSTITSLGTLVGAYLSGQLAYNYGYGTTFIMAGSLIFLTFYIYTLMPNRQVEKKGAALVAV